MISKHEDQKQIQNNSARNMRIRSSKFGSPKPMIKRWNSNSKMSDLINEERKIGN